MIGALMIPGNRRRLLVCVAILAGILCVGSTAIAKDGEGHRKDYEAIIGISALNPEGQKHLDSMAKGFAEAIDSVDAFYRNSIKSDPNFQNFTYGLYSHRLLFHWGFNGDPRKHAPLVERVKACRWTEKVESEFYDTLLKEQSRRNDAMMDSARDNLGLYERSRKNAIAALIYDVHLLGDLVEQNGPYTGKAVQDLAGITADLQKTIKDRLFRDRRTGVDLAKKLGLLSKPGASDKEKAQLLLDTLKAELPPLIAKGDDGILGRIFKEKGIAVKSE